MHTHTHRLLHLIPRHDFLPSNLSKQAFFSPNIYLHFLLTIISDFVFHPLPPPSNSHPPTHNHLYLTFPPVQRFLNLSLNQTGDI